jgi:hypothetical protein
MCTLRGRDVAAIGSPAPEGMPPTWGTCIWVDDVDATAAKVKGAGGSLVMEPFDSLDGGHMAVAADPSGAVFGLWPRQRCSRSRDTSVAGPNSPCPVTWSPAWHPCGRVT